MLVIPVFAIILSLNNCTTNQHSAPCLLAMEQPNMVPSIKLVQFDVLKQTQIAAALQAVATEQEHASTSEKRALLRDGEVVSLLSDSDDDEEESEVLGYLSTEPENAISNAHLPLVMKEEQIEQGNLSSSTSNMIAGSELKYLKNGDIEVVTTTMVNADATGDLEDFIDSTVVYYQPERTFNANCDDGSIKSYKALLPPQTSFPTILAAAETNYVGIKTDNSVVADFQRVPSTGIVPQAVTENNLEDGSTYATSCIQSDEHALNHTLPACNFDETTDDSNSITQPISDEVIELDDSSDDDGDIDAETEMKLIELLDSDSEDNVQEQYNEQATSTSVAGTDANVASNNDIKTIDMLMHYYCPECDHPCGSLKKWRAHMQVEHNFEAIANLNMQTIIDRNGGLQYQCKNCPIKFKQKRPYGTILKHRITHMPFPFYYKCRLCPSRFKNRAGLRRHLSKDHYKICKEYVGRKFTLWKYITLYCPVCNATQSTFNRWRKHLEDKHDYSNRVENEFMTKTSIADTDVYKCQKCKRNFGRRNYFEHCIGHEPFSSLRCNLCENFTSNSRCYIYRHVRETHLEVGQPRLQCSYCESKFFKRSEREMHVKQTHHIKKLKCKMCDCEFNSPQNLLTHMRKTNHVRLK